MISRASTTLLFVWLVLLWTNAILAVNISEENHNLDLSVRPLPPGLPLFDECEFVKGIIQVASSSRFQPARAKNSDWCAMGTTFKQGNVRFWFPILSTASAPRFRMDITFDYNEEEKAVVTATNGNLRIFCLSLTTSSTRYFTNGTKIPHICTSEVFEWHDLNSKKNLLQFTDSASDDADDLSVVRAPKSGFLKLALDEKTQDRDAAAVILSNSGIVVKGPNSSASISCRHGRLDMSLIVNIDFRKNRSAHGPECRHLVDLLKLFNLTAKVEAEVPECSVILHLGTGSGNEQSFLKVVANINPFKPANTVLKMLYGIKEGSDYVVFNDPGTGVKKTYIGNFVYSVTRTGIRIDRGPSHLFIDGSHNESTPTVVELLLVQDRLCPKPLVSKKSLIDAESHSEININRELTNLYHEFRELND